jgi:hypothetical protein
MNMSAAHLYYAPAETVSNQAAIICHHSSFTQFGGLRAYSARLLLA